MKLPTDLSNLCLVEEEYEKGMHAMVETNVRKILDGDQVIGGDCCQIVNHRGGMYS